MLKGSQSMKFRNTYIVVALAASVLTLPVSTDAAGPQVRARFSFDGLANCENPPVRNFPIHGEGTGVLSVDRSATMDVSSNVGGEGAVPSEVGRRSDSCARRICLAPRRGPAHASCRQGLSKQRHCHQYDHSRQCLFDDA